MKIIDIPPALLAALEATHADPWDPPEPFTGSLLPVPPFNAEDLLPEPLLAFCKSEAHRMQCPIEFVAVTLIVAIGSVIGRSIAIYPKAHDDWYEFANVWGACIGRPSQMKTPSMNAALAPLNKLAEVAAKDHVRSLSTYETELTRHKMLVDMEKKKLRPTAKKETNSTAFTTYVDLLASAPTEPVERRFIVNDATTEKLGEILRSNPRGVLTVRDELTGLLEMFNKQGHEGDRTFYLEAWNGKQPFVFDRVSRGTIAIAALCLSVIGGIQPTRLQHYLEELRNQVNDGLLQRFQLMVYPDEVEQRTVVDEAPDVEARAAVAALFFSLAHETPTQFGAQVDEGRGIHYLRFAAGPAQQAMLTWLQRHQRRISREPMPEIQEHLTKYKKLVPALALIFHLIEVHADKSLATCGVRHESLIRAIRWSRFLEAHARRVYALSEDHAVTAAKLLAKHIEAGEEVDGFTARDVYRRGRTGLTSVEAVEEACRELVAAGWIRAQRAVSGAPKKLGRRTQRFEINPGVLSKAR